MRVLAGGKPVAGAEVHAYRHAGREATGEGWKLAARGAADSAGILLVPAAPGAWLVTAAAPGLARGHAEVSRPRGEGTTRVDLLLGPGATLSGRTVERRGQAPLPLVTLSLSPAPASRFRRAEFPTEEQAFATSDARGLFRVAGLSPGRWRIEARAPGHAPATAVTAVPAAGELRIELAGAALIEGTVTRGGQPVPGATVTLTGSGEPATAETGARGAFSVEVDPGVHHVLGRLGEETGAADEAVAAAAGARVRGVEVKLGAAARILGTVRSGAGPVEGATVVASPFRDGGTLGQAATGRDGRYELAGLFPGSYTVRVSAPGHSGAAFPGITVRSGERFPLNAVLADPSAVEGKVSDPGGNPVAGALVTVAGGFRRGGAGPADGGMAARSDASGRYRIEGVPGGPIRVSARRDPSSPPSSRAVSVEEGTTSQVDLVLAEGGLVSGVVLDARSVPIPGAVVAVLDGGGDLRRGGGGRTSADAAGNYLLPLPPGEFGLGAWRPDGAFGGRPAVLASARVGPGERAEVNLVVPDDPDPTVSGLVLEPGGLPSPGAWVRLGPPGAGARFLSAGSDGAFAASAPAGAAIAVSARNGGRAGSSAVTPPARDVVVQLEPAAAVEGTLSGDPAPDTFTVTAGTSGAVPLGPPTRLQFAGTAFAVRDLAAGLVVVHVTAEDGRVGEAQVSVAPGDTGKVEVVLSPAAVVAGRVVDAVSGQPIARGRILVDGVTRRGALGPDGTFRRTVPAGDHQIGVSAPGYLGASRSVSARPGAPSDLGDIALTPAPPGPPGR